MSSLKYVEYPSTIQTIGVYNLCRDGRQLDGVVIKATTPPKATSTLGPYGKLPSAYYVPDSAVDTYKSVTDENSMWSLENIQSRIKPLSELPTYLREMGTVTQEDIDRV